MVQVRVRRPGRKKVMNDVLLMIYYHPSQILFSHPPVSSLPNTHTGMDKKHRHECQNLNIFPSVWPNRKVQLTDEQKNKA